MYVIKERVRPPWITQRETDLKTFTKIVENLNTLSELKRLPLNRYKLASRVRTALSRMDESWAYIFSLGILDRCFCYDAVTSALRLLEVGTFFRTIKLKPSLCYHYGISQTYAKMQLIHRYKGENKIYRTKVSDEKCTNRFLLQVIRFNMA